MSTVSYASAAQGKEDAITDSIANIDISSSTEGGNVSEVSKPAAEVTENSENSESVSAESTTEAIDGPTTANTKKQIKKVVLTPAPIPSSVWGQNAQSNSINIDEVKWPTPAKEDSSLANSKPQKFINTITNKWVPIPAKVVLPNQRATKSKRKKKTGNPNLANSNNNAQHDSNNQHQISQNEKLDEKSINGKKNVKSSDKKSDDEEISSDNQQNSDQSDSEQRSSEFNQQNDQQHQNQSNGFYNSSGNNQYRQFRNYRNNSNSSRGNYRNNSQQNYRNYNLPVHPQYQYPQQYQYQPQLPYQLQQQHNANPHQIYPNQQYPVSQIPPPISPKQNPQQALVQQLDYYFSLENLFGDFYLRQRMDSEGWINLSVILGFKRVAIIINLIANQLHNNTAVVDSVIISSLKSCQNLAFNLLNDKTWEDASIQDVDLRVKENYDQWLLPAEN